MRLVRSTTCVFALVYVVSLVSSAGAQIDNDEPRPSRYLTWSQPLAEIVARHKGKPLRRGIKSTPVSREAFRYLLKSEVLDAWGEIKKFDGFRNAFEQEVATTYLDEVAKMHA